MIAAGCGCDFDGAITTEDGKVVGFEVGDTDEDFVGDVADLALS